MEEIELGWNWEEANKLTKDAGTIAEEVNMDNEFHIHYIDKKILLKYVNDGSGITILEYNLNDEDDLKLLTKELAGHIIKGYTHCGIKGLNWLLEKGYI